MKPISASTGKEALGWSLSWHPEGRCDSFTKEAILRCAPQLSGLYGLFNRDCQVFIGASANIREALLRHESETDFRSDHLRPTGFTFEPCPAESCKSKLDELIAKFHPVLQTEGLLTEIRAPSDDAMASEGSPREQEQQTSSEDQQFPMHHREEPSETSSYFRPKLGRRLALAALLAASALAVYVGMPADYFIQKRADGANSMTHRSDPSAVRTDEKTASGISPRQDDRSAVFTRTANKISPAGDSAAGQVQSSAQSTNTYSVQVAASSAKDFAEKLERELKGKGYDAYVIQAKVKGQTYYRVRVGHFNAREEAEPLRQLLVENESYRDAYLAVD